MSQVSEGAERLPEQPTVEAGLPREAALSEPRQPAAGARPVRDVLRAARVAYWLPPLLAFLLAAVVWNVYAAHHPYVLPTSAKMWHSLTGSPGMYGSAFLKTLQEIAVGAGSGIVVGFVLAIVMMQLRVLERALMPLVVTLMVTPVVAIAPALVIAFGFGMMPKYLVTAIVVFFPVLVNTLAGLKAVDGRSLDVLKTLHASRWETFWHLQLPGSLPFLFAGLRIALPLAVVGATIADIAAAGFAGGLGALVQTSSGQGDLAVAWTAIGLLCLLGILLTALLNVIRARVLWWDNEAALAKRQ